jgi:hypothetical protein
VTVDVYVGAPTMMRSALILARGGIRVRAILHLRRIVRSGGRRPVSSGAPTASR